MQLRKSWAQQQKSEGEGEGGLGPSEREMAR